MSGVDGPERPPVATSARWPGERLDAPRVASEKEMLQGYLRQFRRTLELKCEGLTAEELGRRSVPPSTMSLHGLVRHLAGVERWWFRINFGHEDVGMLFYTDDDPDLDFEPPPGDDPFADLEVWRAECARSDRIIAAGGLDDEADLFRGAPFTLRWVILRMIAEYAQHCGHADLLRERIDGRTGA